MVRFGVAPDLGDASVNVYCILGNFNDIVEKFGWKGKLSPNLGGQSGDWVILYPEVDPNFRSSGTLDEMAAALSKKFGVTVIGVHLNDVGMFAEYVQCDDGTITLSLYYLDEYMAGRPLEPLDPALWEKYDRPNVEEPEDLGIRRYYRYIDNRVGIDYLTDNDGFFLLNKFLSKRKIYLTQTFNKA